ncbi:hypothetical protein CIT292_08362 [Citrobacter youngae ATCC 29220]|uniref:Uncharacterized protein n=1 Tax=Citrobacter youngae ATCC 29220 TaxID=500640 RepID=D4BCZ6_9ENTR|nr:hypothetical protein CIT292_08362 [Citrobacter youngae ATCC 29220]
MISLLTPRKESISESQKSYSIGIIYLGHLSSRLFTRNVKRVVI